MKLCYYITRNNQGLGRATPPQLIIWSWKTSSLTGTFPTWTLEPSPRKEKALCGWNDHIPPHKSWQSAADHQRDSTRDSSLSNESYVKVLGMRINKHLAWRNYINTIKLLFDIHELTTGTYSSFMLLNISSKICKSFKRRMRVLFMVHILTKKTWSSTWINARFCF